jgi:hypothetical protein
VCFCGEQFHWHFLLAAVAFSPSGADFLVNFKLVVDLASFNVRNPAGKLLRLQSSPVGSAFALLGVQVAVSGDGPAAQQNSGSPPLALQHPCSTPAALHLPCSSTSAQQAVKAAAVVAPGGRKQEYNAVLRQFPAVLNQGKSLPPVKHKVLHHIETEGRPVAAKYHRLDSAKLAAAKKEFFEMEKLDIIRRSNSQWSSPLHMVRKADGSWPT